MKHKPLFLRWLTLVLVLMMLFTALAGCHQQVVEKVGVLPDRPTQFVSHDNESKNKNPVGKSWDVQNADELRLYTSEMVISETPSAHYFDNTAYLHRKAFQDDATTLYSLERIESDGSLTVLHSMTVEGGSYCYYSPDGTTAAYETWVNHCLTLMLVDLASNEERVLWQSDEASILQELGISARLICQWSPDGSTLLFLPICYANDPAQIIDAADNSAKPSHTAEEDSKTLAQVQILNDPAAGESSVEESVLTDSDIIDSSSAGLEESVGEDSSASEGSVDSEILSGKSSNVLPAGQAFKEEEPVNLMALPAYEKMQIIYQALPDFPIIYAYQLDQKNLQSFLIAPEDYPLYDAETVPMICATENGSHFFIYFNSPWDSALAHYVDLSNTLHYSTPLTDYLPSFTRLGSNPMFYGNLLYLHVDGVGIMVFNPNQGSLIDLYPFNDPIHSFTIYDNTLIVAQPSGTGGGVDVTAYLLNLETKQSVLLYHNSETYSPFINHMEMSQDGMHLLIEQLPSGYRTQKQLIQLSFK